ncbi:polyphosphate kinase 1 [uncultured Croceitalea sp.]|uniref:polyphosphate kinase 1 n=1 Tax=uncultured Croceitalea sp. TaxID=1798908 RepID=UPI0033064DC8
MKDKQLKHRDVNWLYFNERVLLEAGNKDTPLFERLKFLAIFSSNLDEFFKVRVSRLRQLKAVDKNLRKKLVRKPNKTLKFILAKVASQQETFGKIIKATLSELREHHIFLREPRELSKEQLEQLALLFKAEIQQHCTILSPITVTRVQDGGLYLVVHFEKDDLALVLIPAAEIPRFIELTGSGANYIFLDEVLKLNVQQLFPNKKIQGAYTIKLSRDAELYLEDDYSDTELVEKIYASLGKRSSGQPTRLLYDQRLPKSVRDRLKQLLDLADIDLMAGGTHHNLSDFFGFPNPPNSEHLRYVDQPPLKHPTLSFTTDIFNTLKEKDQLVHFPYQRFDSVENFIIAAATDANVRTIKMSLYRIAKTSRLTDAILTALENGKEVLLFVEARARFDEANNIKWGRVFEEKGARVIFSVPNIKVHSKIALVERFEDEVRCRYAYIGTGNFNAKTAKLYCDHGLFTAHKKITKDLSQVFEVLERKLIIPKLKHLLVSPFTTRSTLLEHIQNEIANVQSGLKGKITLKMNSLEDTKMIAALYAASEAGVEIRLLVRGFCRLKQHEETNPEPNEKLIFATSIIDRYLEHGRIYLFENGGDEKMYIGSADWMTRNLDKRIEVLTPILDRDVFQELKDILSIQLNDTVKARILDTADTNSRFMPEAGATQVRSQYAIYKYLKDKLDETR